MKRIYFAHPINVYGTAFEMFLLGVLRARFPGDTLVNPGDKEHIDAVTAMRQKDPKANVMPYFIKLVNSCDELVALPFLDGKWGAGVFDEAERMFAPEKSGWVWRIHPTRFSVQRAHTLKPEWKLSVEETRARIRNQDGTTKPYA